MNARDKLPEITLAFWIMKIIATTLGETAGDLFSMTLHLGYAWSSIALLGLFVLTLCLQLASSQHHAPLYWLVILSTSTAGTTMSDYVDRTLGLGYARGSALLLGGLIAVLSYWRLSEKTLSVRDIRSFKAELLFWLAVLLSNTLGTALGDFAADSSRFGYVGGALLFGSLVAITAAANFTLPVSKALLFWAAFVLTRPLGATLGDLLTKPEARGGFDLGTIGSSSALLLTLTVMLLWSARKDADRTPRR